MPSMSDIRKQIDFVPLQLNFRSLESALEMDSLTITGGKLQGAAVHGWDDHRIVMALAIAGMVAGDTIIDTTESVSISYPDFFKDISRIGAKIEQIPEE